jgi:hypothetical protein
VAPTSNSKTGSQRAITAETPGSTGPAPTAQESPGPEASDRLGANAAGAASGTLLAVLAQSLPDRSQLRLWLLLLTPTFSMLFSSVWLWLKRVVENRIHQKEKEQLFRRLQETILRSIKDPNLAEDSKEYLRKQLAELKRLEVSGLIQQIRFLKEEMNK